MTEVLVSVRIPRKLDRKLKEAAMDKHYLDVSEAVRSIIRQRWFLEKDPVIYQLDRIKDEINAEIHKIKGR